MEENQKTCKDCKWYNKETESFYIELAGMKTGDFHMCKFYPKHIVIEDPTKHFCSKFEKES